MAAGDALYKIAYDQARHDLAVQQTVLEALKTRTTTVLGAGAVAVAVAAEDSGALMVLAGAVYVVLAVLAAAILMPRKKWHFSQNVNQLVRFADGDDPPTAGRAHRNLAIYLQRDRRENQRHIDHLTNLFGGCCVLLGAEVLLAFLRLG